jgi:hypothetical protein
MTPRNVWLVILLGAAIFTGIEVVTLGLWFQGSTPPVVFSGGGKLDLIVGIYLEHAVSLLVGIAVGNAIAGKTLFPLW